MKRSHDSSEASSEEKQGYCKRREVTYYTYKKWMTELDRSCQTISWLDCDTRVTEGKKVVTKLKCKICTKFKARINGRKHFSNKWIEGADSIKTSNIRDHANADQHIQAMELEKKGKHKPRGSLSHHSHYQDLFLKHFPRLENRNGVDSKLSLI